MLLAVPQPTEWQHIGNQINTKMILVRSDFVFMHGFESSYLRRRFFVLITRFPRTNIGCGGGAPVICSVLSPMIAGIRALKSSVVSTGRLAGGFFDWLYF
jgi:hypothetical protein